ncbi:thioredoxin family protein [Hydrogenimonas sp.]
MRRIVALVLAALALQAGGIRWHGSFDRALEAAQAQQKPMFVVLVARGCTDCRRLFATTLRDERVVRRVQREYVAVIVTKENEDYPIELLYTLVYPTIFLLSPEEVLLKPPLSGLVDARLLEEKLFDE